MPKKAAMLTEFFAEVRKARLIPGTNGIVPLKFPRHTAKRSDLDIKMYSRVGDPTTEVVAPKYYFSCKAGPNGISCLTRIADSLAVLQHPNLKYDLQKFVSLSVKGVSDKYVDDVLTNSVNVKPKGKPFSLGKLSLSHEPGKSKPRVFAIVDSVTQQCLKPYHNSLMNNLKTIDEDCTEDHTKVTVRAKEL